MLKKMFVAIARIFLIATVIAQPLLGNSLSARADTIDLDRGAKVFEENCAGCHVKGGNIVRRGKNLKLKTLKRNKVATQEAIAELTTNGKGIMSAYGDKLTEGEIADVSAYVLQKAQENWQ